MNYFLSRSTAADSVCISNDTATICFCLCFWKKTGYPWCRADLWALKAKFPFGMMNYILKYPLGCLTAMDKKPFCLTTRLDPHEYRRMHREIFTLINTSFPSMTRERKGNFCLSKRLKCIYTRNFKPFLCCFGNLQPNYFMIWLWCILSPWLVIKIRVTREWVKINLL